MLSSAFETAAKVTLSRGLEVPLKRRTDESGGTPNHLRLWVQPFRIACIEGQSSASDDQQEDQAKEHAHIRVRFVQRAPKAVLHERDDLGRVQGHANVDEQGHAGKAGEQTSQEERAASDLGDSNERGHELWEGNTDLRKAAHSQQFWEHKLLNAFGKENPANKNANEQDRLRCAICPDYVRVRGHEINSSGWLPN